MHSSRRSLLTHKQLSDEEGTKKEKHRNAESTDCADSIGPYIFDWVSWNLVHAVERKDCEEGEETQCIKFGAIVPLTRLDSID